jgi:hypothetical protein
MVARLSDELLRTFGSAEEILHQSISYLKPVGRELVRTDESVLFAATGRGDQALFDRLGYAKAMTSEFARGLRYPEEAGSELPATDLPADWATTLSLAQFSADVARDPRARFITSLVSIARKTLEEIETALGKPMTGTRADWTLFAPYAKHTIVFTQEVPGDVVVEGVVKGGTDTYVILDPEGTPYQVKATGSFVVAEADLPPRLKTSLDAFVA